MKDLSTGNVYQVADFIPLHVNEFSDRVETFRLKGTPETVHVPFLRLKADGMVCSLMAKG